MGKLIIEKDLKTSVFLKTYSCLDPKNKTHFLLVGTGAINGGASTI